VNLMARSNNARSGYSVRGAIGGGLRLRARLRRNQRDAGKVRSVPPHIAGQDRAPERLRVRADEEVGKDSGANATEGTVTAKDLAREKKRTRGDTRWSIICNSRKACISSASVSICSEISA
jgi:hypothetical protein